MRRLPWSLSWFALTGVVFLLQLFPFTGIFLMLVAAPYWSILTVNAGFVSLAFEAGLGSISRVWLLVPAVWFGGYAIAAEMSTRAFDRLDAEVRAENALRSMPFDPSRADLVIAANADDLGGAAARLVANYRLPVVYTEHNRGRRTPRANELPSLEAQFTAQRIAGADVCKRLRSGSRYRAARASGSAVREGANYRTAVDTGLCSYSMPEAPSRAFVRVEAKGQRLASFMLSGKVVGITITAPDGEHIALRSGQVAPLMRWPMPVMGCALNSGAPSWQCSAGFMKQRPKGLGGSGAWGAATIEVVARALGLEGSPAVDRRDELAGADTSAVDGLLERHEGAALANLQRVLEDPTLRATVHDLAGLAERPELLAPRADAMLAAMSAALVHGKGSSETARNLQRLIAALPAAVFSRVGEDVIRRLEDGRPQTAAKSRRPVRERIDGALATRLGDLGADALPLLERLAFEHRGESAAYAILGLCRMGAPAANLADRLAAHAGADGNTRSDVRAAAYVTLVRWGRTDLAEALSGPEDASNRRNYARRWPGLSPASGPQVCTLRYRA